MYIYEVWLVKLFALQTDFNTFVDHSSVAEKCTTQVNMNRMGKTSAAKGVEKNYNEYSEIHTREFEAHVCAAFLEMTGMKTFEGLTSLW